MDDASSAVMDTIATGTLTFSGEWSDEGCIDCNYGMTMSLTQVGDSLFGELDYWIGDYVDGANLAVHRHVKGTYSGNLAMVSFSYDKGVGRYMEENVPDVGGAMLNINDEGDLKFMGINQSKYLPDLNILHR